MTTKSRWVASILLFVGLATALLATVSYYVPLLARWAPTVRTFVLVDIRDGYGFFGVYHWSERGTYASSDVRSIMFDLMTDLEDSRKTRPRQFRKDRVFQSPTYWHTNGFGCHIVTLPFPGPPDPPVKEYCIGLPMWFVVGVLGALVIVHRWISRSGRVPDGVCTKCGYNLTGNVSGTCPECGTEVEKP
ncbi:MAG: hypothetical protein JSU63_17460 [Phycisphaerales bacterium]|nr:MAG: hypothetical protein JSU63_17460 [Phycisphaerales bacterium]